ncbi:MAG: hypothetical protein ACREFP_11510, partial [Acetobacteraceae bacterium]
AADDADYLDGTAGSDRVDRNAAGPPVDRLLVVRELTTISLQPGRLSSRPQSAIRSPTTEPRCRRASLTHHACNVIVFTSNTCLIR